MPAAPLAPQVISLSVVIPAYNARATIVRCLRALEPQTQRADVEVLVVDSSTDGTAALVAREFPAVRLWSFPERKFPGDARNYGIAQARGKILAFTDADCEVERQWIDQMLAAHQHADPIIGGAVTNGSPRSPVSWGYYFCEFSGWLPHLPAGPREEIPTCCLSIKRWMFDRYGPFLEGTYCSDSAWQWKVGEAGYVPRFVPTIRVAHCYQERLLVWLRHAVQHGRAFARVRVRERRWSRARRLSYAVGAPLLPVVVFWRIARRVWTDRAQRRRFVVVWPVVLVGVLAWVWGEARGYVESLGYQR
jgi:glycosyltransferase involved in cell wall biosynthesis